MNKNRLIKHKSMILSKTCTEEELYVDDIDQSEDDMKCNICEKEFPRLAVSWDLIPMLIRKQNKKENTRILKELSKPLQCEYCHKTVMTKLNLKRHNLTLLYNYFNTMYEGSIKKSLSVLVNSICFLCSWGYNIFSKNPLYGRHRISA